MLYDEKGNKIIDAVYNNLAVRDNYILASDEYKLKIMDFNNNVLFDFEYGKIHSKWGILSETTIINKNLYITRKDDNIILIKSNGEIVDSVSNNGSDIIKLFHKNIDSSPLDDYMDAVDTYIAQHEASYTPSLSKAQIRECITEMVYSLKQPKKVFPVNSLNESSLNDYMCRTNYMGDTVVYEYERSDFENVPFMPGNDLDQGDLDSNRFIYQQGKDTADYNYRKNKDDNEYNKIKLVYDYLKENIIISEDNTNIYDVIFNSKGNYDSLSITLQYILERLGIESYIIKNDKYTYNIVKINKKWYTLDFYDKDGLLKGSKTSKVYNKKDYNGLNITVDYLRYKNSKKKVSTITLEDISANKEYLISTFDVVEDTTSKVPEKPTHIITRPVIINKEEDNSNKEFIKSSMEFLLLGLIIILVILVIYKYTKKV